MKLFDASKVKATMGTTKTQPNFKEFKGVKPKRTEDIEQEYLDKLTKELREYYMMKFCE